MTDQPQDNFLHVPTLLESSQPRPRGAWLWYAIGAFLLVVLASSLLSSRSGAMAQLVSVFSGFLMVGIIVGMALLTWVAVKRARTEHQQLEAVEELIQLRRWPQAAAVLQHMLAQPTRTPAARVHALMYLASVLARYGRFEDAIIVYNHLLDHVNLDPAAAHALRLGRAMAMLREDHLVDADRAINELRRDLRDIRDIRDIRDSEDAQPEPAAQPESAGLALVELYRDVKTGHPAEAVELFNGKLSAFREKLGHRTGDAWALLAKAHDMLGQTGEAQAAWENATLLTDRLELERRYPEVQSLSSKYRSAESPAAAAVAA
jgi:tetratricopeptide (TPR) repeat protein